MPKPFLLEARDVAQAWKIMVPEYRSAVYSPLVVQIKHWEQEYVEDIFAISEKRSRNRIENYIIPEEIDRVSKRLDSSRDASIRFGSKKEGHGYHGERGDFCLVGGSISAGQRRVGGIARAHLTLMYRSLELIGGFAYDLVLVSRLGDLLGLEWKSLTILAARAHVFALKGNSNEKLFPKLQKVFSK